MSRRKDRKDSKSKEELSKLSKDQLIDRLYDKSLDGMENRDKRRPIREELKRREK